MDILGYITYFWLWNPKMAISECGKLFDPRRLHDPESPVWSSATPRHTNPGARFWQLTGADSLGSSWHVLQDYTPSRSLRNHGLGLLLFKQYNPFTSCFQPYHKMLITRSFCFWVCHGRFFVFVLQFKLVTATSFHPIPCFIACIRIFARKVLFLVAQNSSFPAKSSGFFRFYGEKCSGAFFLTSAACCFLRSA